MFGRAWWVYHKIHLNYKGDGRQTIEIWSDGVMEYWSATGKPPPDTPTLQKKLIKWKTFSQ